MLIGPPGSGKSTVGRLLADHTGREFVDADADAEPWYAEAGWSVTRLRRRADEAGFERAHREWEVALAAAVTGLVQAHPQAVLALGAGHSHITTPSLYDSVATTLRGADQVVLLRPSVDPSRSLVVLRNRCRATKGHDWIIDGTDWLARWLSDGRDECLATHVVLTDGQDPAQTAARIAVLSEHSS